MQRANRDTCTGLEGEDATIEDLEQFEQLQKVLKGLETKRDVREKGTSHKLLKNNGYECVQEAFLAQCRNQYLEFRRNLAEASDLFHPYDPQHLSGCAQIYDYKVRLCAEAVSNYLFAGLRGCLSTRNTRAEFPTLRGRLVDVCGCRPRKLVHSCDSSHERSTVLGMRSPLLCACIHRSRMSNRPMVERRTKECPLHPL